MKPFHRMCCCVFLAIANIVIEYTKQTIHADRRDGIYAATSKITEAVKAFENSQKERFK